VPPTRATHPGAHGGRWRRQARGHGTVTSPWSWTADRRSGDGCPEQGGRCTVEARFMGHAPVQLTDGWTTLIVDPCQTAILPVPSRLPRSKRA
jgi:hypothetical protein